MTLEPLKSKTGRTLKDLTGFRRNVINQVMLHRRSPTGKWYEKTCQLS